MSTGGTGGTRRARDGKLPAGHRPPGGGQRNPAASDAPTDKRPTTPTKRKERLEKADMINVIRPANSRFKTLLDYRKYFLIRRQLTYTPKEAQRSHCLNKRLYGAVHG